ncbi:MAG: hypothetical protein ABSD67_11830 [Terracidiphilus sp.]
MKSSCTSLPAILAVSVFLLTISSTFSLAQSTTPAPAQSPAPVQSTTPTPGQATAPAQTGAPVLAAKLASSLNTKTAKVGDVVTAKTITTLKLKDGVEIPKGSRIVGTVAAVQSAQAGNGTSSLAIKIDQVEMKDGKFMRVAGLITAIGPFPDTVGLGYDSVLGRGGVGSSVGLDPAIGAGPAVNRGDPDIPRGSTLEGIRLGARLDASQATELRGEKREIKLDSTVMIKVALFRPSGA